MKQPESFPAPAARGADSLNMSAMLPYGRQALNEDDIQAVAEALRRERITQGPLIEAFERRVAEYCGARYAVAMANGTAALHAACAVAGLGTGDEAITSPLTFSATAAAVLHCGAQPVLADIREDTLNLDPAAVESRLAPRTRAILPVDFAGLPADLDAIREIARKRELVVIEDAAHALGAELRGRKIGGLSDMTILSFHPVKHITTGEGGMVLTNNPEYSEKLRLFRHHGIVREPARWVNGGGAWYYEVQELGHNFRITDFQCALGLSQMEKLEGFIRRRREIAALYNSAFGRLTELILPVEPEGFVSSYHIYVLQFRLERMRATRGEIFDALQRDAIGVNVHYVPLHFHPLYQRRCGYRIGDFPVAERYYERALTLPLFPAMSDADVERVIGAVERVVARYRKSE